ncbi:D-alanyl-D-alanine carboxypeptidase family protein [Promicromonospora sp. NPDC023987]|uniref:M15 family metallopeptidase n=1 Tax=Promicromonospora sp. NPDC023987 TaxID=3155360 RepID=UPI0033CFE5E3
MTEQPSEHKPGAAFVREHGARLRRAAESRHVRHAWTGVIALAMTGGVLVSASASTATSGLPVLDAAESTTAATARRSAVAAPSSPGSRGHETRAPEAGTDGVTVGQVLAVLDRAERTLRQASSPNPRVAQAGAELGMLYTTYEAQQFALAAAAEPLRVETAPVAGRARTTPATEALSAEPVSRVVAMASQQAPAHPVRAHAHPEQQGTGYVTFDEVAVAAMRLANMLDPSSPSALVETLPGAEPSLRRSLLETVAAYGESTAGYANGRIPADALCPLPFAPGHLLRCDAAERLTALSDEFEKEFGYPIPLTDSYRPYAMQVAVKGSKPHLAAIPGTSNHGWGLAIDLDDPIAGGSSPEYVWLRLHAPDYGWDNPSWAQLDGAKPEPWHFEFFAAGSIPNRAIDPADVGTWAPSAPAAHGDSRPELRPASGGSPSSTRPAQDSADEHGTGGGSQPVDEPAAPAEPEPSKPAPEEPTTAKPSEPEPTDPPTKQPGSGSDAIDDTVRAVDDTVNGIVTGVGDAVGGLLGAGGTTNGTGS